MSRFNRFIIYTSKRLYTSYEQFKVHTNNVILYTSLLSQDVLVLRETIRKMETSGSISDSKAISECSNVQRQIKEIDDITFRFDDIQALFDLAVVEQDTLLQEDSILQMKRLIDDARELFLLRSFSSSEYDSGGCYLQIQAGIGGQDAFDWTSMLKNMYLKWALSHGYHVTEIEKTRDNNHSDLYRNYILRIKGHRAYGFLKLEAGVHRLVRISPFDSKKKRHTSFAQLLVYPEALDDRNIAITIDMKDLRIDTYKSQGGEIFDFANYYFLILFLIFFAVFPSFFFFSLPL